MRKFTNSRIHPLLHVGIIVGLAAATATAVGFVPSAAAVDGNTASTYVPIDPCRLADTRAKTAADPTQGVGARLTPLKAQETVPFTVWGTNGNCTIPTSATGIATNVTAVNPNASSYLTVWPADAATRPTASNLNWIATSPPTPNQVTVGLSSAGVINAFSNAGTVDLIIDIVGYYQAAGAGQQGPAGPAGPKGDTGDIGATGAAGRSALDTLPSGTKIVGISAWTVTSLAGMNHRQTISLPFTLSPGFQSTDIIFGANAVALPTVVDASCSGTPDNPVAPAGKLCMYISGPTAGTSEVFGSVINSTNSLRDLVVEWDQANLGATSLTITWVYVAP
jgi:hypothetical protein